MKKITTIALVITLLLNLHHNVFAQKGIQVGAGWLPQTTWLLNKNDFDAGDELDHVPTFKLSSVGATIGYNFTNSIGIKSGFILSSQGQKYEGKILNTKAEWERQLSYLKIPLLFHFNTNPEANTMFVLEAGIQLAKLTSAKYMVQGEEVIFKDTNGDNIATTEFWKSSLIQPTFAFGPAFNMGKLTLNALLRFDGDLSDAENKDAKIGTVSVYSANREANKNVTGGLWLTLNYKL